VKLPHDQIIVVMMKKKRKMMVYIKKTGEVHYILHQKFLS
jgi:hypothetical protein